jgi:heme oxygenase
MMRELTHGLHAQAERSGIINDILRNKASRYGYALLLRNLLPAYRQLEAGLEAHRRSPAVGTIARREIYRAPALASDLAAIFGTGWESALPLLPAGEQYARRVAAAAQGDGIQLIAHAYTRYFGDLSGGKVLKVILARSLGLRPQELAFYDFPKIIEIDRFKQDYRRAIDDCAVLIADSGMVVCEAMTAFELNIAVSEAVQRVSASPVLSLDD